MAEKNEQIVIGLPNTGTFGWLTVVSILSLRVPRGLKIAGTETKDYGFNFNIVANCLVYDARERLARYAVDIGAKYVFFLDSDMVPPADTLEKLVAADKDIISGMIFQRKYPFQPCFYTKCRLHKVENNEAKKTNKYFGSELEGPLKPEEWPNDGAYEMEGVGMACTLIKTEVFKKLNPPWFFPLPGVGEDLSFCVQARNKGAKVYTHFGVDCGHTAEFTITKETFANALTEWLKDPNNQGKLIFTAHDVDPVGGKPMEPKTLEGLKK
jgi:hypothetical protein